ncbi:MAG TPA: helix-turn-helix domain-containing protein [Solirubrobacteraceae bacterium]|nr:helix-turn-helix domain-containing protein [Solirubrobacteraceae bacterium]
MEAAWLASRLEAGRSIESIAREAGRSASTVGYWVNKHGLTSRHAPKHAARDGIARDSLEALVALGMPIRQMADQLGVSYTTVRHWLKRYELTTARARRIAQTTDARASGAATIEGDCPQHGPVTFVRRGRDGFRCQLCRMDAVDRRRREIKRILVAEAGGAGSSAATHARSQRCTSTTLIQPRSPLLSARPDSRGRSRSLVLRRRSACSFAHAVMPRSRRVSSGYPFRR